MTAFQFLLKALSWKRLALAAALTMLATLIVIPYFASGTRFFYLWARLFVVGVVMLLGYETATVLHPRLNRPRLKLVQLQIAGLVLFSVLGTIASGLLIGRSLDDMINVEPIFWGMVIFTAVGISVGVLTATVLVYREQAARAAAEAATADAQRHELEKQVLEARLKLMQAQIEPHFLFNTLANVQHLVEANPPLAGKTLDSLITYLRAALPDMREGGTTLGREAHMARAYLEIQQIRMGKRLAFTVDIPPELADRPFPPMMLMTLVENAIKHGIDPMQQGGEIRIGAIREKGEGGGDEAMLVSVADNGQGLATWSNTGIGLQNIRERLHALFGRQAKLLLEENAPRGVVAKIRIPVEKS
ncbi:MAG: histidine kinase [Betaproteobacteria bacterium]|nr:histidine kinase [Betaproteobacteria bacterium]